MRSAVPLAAWLLPFTLFCGAAHAQSASAAFSSLSYQLTDLAPADGVTPALELTPQARAGSVTQYSDGNMSNALREIDVAESGAVSLSDGAGNGSLSLAPGLIRLDVAAQAGAYAGRANSAYTFVLSPNTRVVFTAMTMSAVGGDPGDAFSSIGLVGQYSGEGPLPGFEAFNIRLGPGSSELPIAVVANAGVLPASGQINLLAYAYAIGPLPIPEPSQWLMLLAGLGGLSMFTFLRARRCPRIARVSALLLAAAASPQAFAQLASATASTSGFSYELLDLDLSDGITPSLTFTGDAATGTIWANENNILGFPWDEQRTLSGAGSVAIQRPAGGVQLDLGDDATRSSATAYRGAFLSSGRIERPFELTPHSLVVFSVNAAVDLAHGVGTGHAASFINGEIFNSDGQRTQFDSALLLTTPGSIAYLLSVAAFTGESTASGYVTLHSEASATGLPPIPEPAAWIMLAAGLGVVSARAMAAKWTRWRQQAARGDVSYAEPTRLADVGWISNAHPPNRSAMKKMPLSPAAFANQTRGNSISC